MKLTLKLSLVLSAIISLLLCGALWIAYRGELRRLRDGQDASLRAAVAHVAERCEPSQEMGYPSNCSDALGLLASAAPDALYDADAIDVGQRILARARQGVDAPYLASASNRPGIWSGSFEFPDHSVVRVFTHPLLSKGANVGVVVAAFRENALRRELEGVYRESRVRFVQACLSGTAVGLILSLAIVGYFLAPLGALVEGVRRVGAGDFSKRLPEDRRDELGQLSAEFNRMASKLAEHEDVRKGFLSQITHDLRNPLHAMLGTMDVLLAGYRGSLAPGQSESVKNLVENGRTMSDLVNNIVDIDRFEDGKFDLEPDSLELTDAIASIVELFQASAQKNGVRLQTQLAPVPEDVYADPQAFRRIMTNLVSNAIKFTPSGGSVTIKTWLGRRQETVVSVSDTGIGIPKDRQGMLFGKFSRIPETRNKVRASPGAGLGLFICKSLVEAHGGTIWFESELHKGATFHCAFPTDPKAAAPTA